MNSSLATGLWTRVAEDVSKAVGRLVGYWQALGLTEGGLVRVRSFDPAVPGEREIRKLRGVPIEPGDGVITITLPRLFEVAVGAVLRTDQTDAGLGSEIVPEHAHDPADPFTIYEGNAQTAATTTSTTDTVNYQIAVSDTIALGAGTWTLKVMAQGNFSHSASGSMSRALEVDGSVVGAGTVTLTTTRETYPVNADVSGVAGGRTVTCRLVYRSNSAGTTACRAPMIQITAEQE